MPAAVVKVASVVVVGMLMLMAMTRGVAKVEEVV